MGCSSSSSTLTQHDRTGCTLRDGEKQAACTETKSKQSPGVDLHKYSDAPRTVGRWLSAKDGITSNPSAVPRETSAGARNEMNVARIFSLGAGRVQRGEGSERRSEGERWDDRLYSKNKVQNAKDRGFQCVIVTLQGTVTLFGEKLEHDIYTLAERNDDEGSDGARACRATTHGHMPAPGIVGLQDLVDVKAHDLVREFQDDTRSDAGGLEDLSESQLASLDCGAAEMGVCGEASDGLVFLPCQRTEAQPTLNPGARLRHLYAALSPDPLEPHVVVRRAVLCPPVFTDLPADQQTSTSRYGADASL